MLYLSLIVGYGGGGGFSSGSESANNRLNANGSLRSVYLHEPAVIQEIPRTLLANSGGVGGGGGASLSGLSGRRTLSKDEISNYVSEHFYSIVGVTI